MATNAAPETSLDSAQIKRANAELVSLLGSNDPAQIKEAAEINTDYTRMKLREDGIARAVLPFEPFTFADCDPDENDDKPTKVFEKEPDSPGAITLPYGTTAESRYLKGSKYRIVFNRIATRKFEKDVNELGTYQNDLRKIVIDNSIKDMMAHEDGGFISILNAIAPTPGAANFGTSATVLDRAGLTRAMKVMPLLAGKLHPACVIVNHVTVWDIVAQDRTAVGGDLAQEMFVRGAIMTEIMGVKMVVTNKTDLVAVDDLYMLAAPKFLGRACELVAPTVHMEVKDGIMSSTFVHETIGAAIANTAGVARYRFNA